MKVYLNKPKDVYCNYDKRVQRSLEKGAAMRRQIVKSPIDLINEIETNNILMSKLEE